MHRRLNRPQHIAVGIAMFLMVGVWPWSPPFDNLFGETQAIAAAGETPKAQPPAAGRLASAVSPAPATSLTTALDRAGANHTEIQRALDDVPESQRRGMEFLIRYMPDRDLQYLDADFLLENVDLAYTAWETAPWRDQVSEEMFLEYILPYAVVNEVRTPWRQELRAAAAPIVATAGTPGEAAVRLNQQIFPLYGVKYSTERSKPDQNPIEVIDEQKASCSGLSILLISACRAAGVPARFTGVPLWADSSGNHSWVEVWDDGWHFTGAAEPAGNDLDKGWFEDRAAQLPGEPAVHAVYASRYSPTGIAFPLVWDESIDYVPAEDVTNRYTAEVEAIPDGSVPIHFVARNQADGQRIPAQVTVYDSTGRTVFEGKTHRDDADMNDHLTTTVPRGASFTVRASHEGLNLERRVKTAEAGAIIEFDMSKASRWGRPQWR